MEYSSPCNLEIFINKHDINDGVLKVTKEIRPEWNFGKVVIQIFTDGITNRVVGIHEDGSPEDTIMIRVYGEETQNIIDHRNEINIMKFFHTLGLSSKIYAVFKNGLAYQYLEGTTLDKISRNNNKVFLMVAEKMAKFHQQLPAYLKQHREKEIPILWNKINTFLSLFSNRNQEKLCTPIKIDASAGNELILLTEENLSKELEWLINHLDHFKSPVVFCHNDLLLGNVLYNQETETVNFIDFEYAGPNYQAYDIANHFCEISGTDSNKWTAYPDENFRSLWIQSYLKVFSPSVASKTHVAELLKTVEQFRLASHFFCGAWGLYQSLHSTLDFNFSEYFILRFKEYYRVKTELAFQ